jgi:hypothetical protein
LKFKRKNRYSRARGIAETYIHIVNVPESLTKNEAYSYLEKEKGSGLNGTYLSFLG